MLKKCAMVVLCVMSLGIYAAEATQPDNYQQQINQLQEEMQKMMVKMPQMDDCAQVMRMYIRCIELRPSCGCIGEREGVVRYCDER